MTAHDLARRAVACRHWRWAPGMLSRCDTDTRRAVYRWLVGLDTRHYGIVCVVEDKHGRPCRSVATLQPGPDDLPDLTDQATLGCLLALVREAWRDSLICVAVDNTSAGWWVDGWTAARPQVPCDLHPTEAVALVAALEGAP